MITTFDSTVELVSTDLNRVSTLITEQLTADVPLIEQIAAHTVESGGKRLRPILVLLSSLSAGYEGQEHIRAAAIIELIHTATLIHDDVVDYSEQRRGAPTAHTLWGNAKSVLVGDFLYARSFQLMTQLSDASMILPILSTATTVIAEGEVLQLMHRHNPGLSEKAYFKVITSKTAKLFEAATQIGALVAQAPPAITEALREYGLQTGLAFQLVDDCLDYADSSTQLGKNVGDDLAEGKMTLPLIYALQSSDSATRTALQGVIKAGDRQALEMVRQAIRDTGALERTQAAARQAAQAACHALSPLPASDYKAALVALADFAVSRLS